MKPRTVYDADDGKPFDNAEECLAYEARLPFEQLFAKVEEAVLADKGFRDKVEMLGTGLARDRIKRRELKRVRVAAGSVSAEVEIDASEPEAPCTPVPGSDELWITP